MTVGARLFYVHVIVLWVLACCGYGVSEVHAASVFRVEVSAVRARLGYVKAGLHCSLCVITLGESLKVNGGNIAVIKSHHPT
jgi:hypothetical protein